MNFNDFNNNDFKNLIFEYDLLVDLSDKKKFWAEKSECFELIWESESEARNKAIMLKNINIETKEISLESQPIIPDQKFFKEVKEDLNYFMFNYERAKQIIDNKNNTNAKDRLKQVQRAIKLAVPIAKNKIITDNKTIIEIESFIQISKLMISFNGFKNLIFEYDLLVDLSDKKKFWAEKSKCFELIWEGEPEASNKSVMLKTMIMEAKDIPVTLPSFIPDQEFCRQLKENEKFYTFNYNRAKEIIKSMSLPDFSSKIKKYTDRHRLIERAINLTVPLDDLRGQADDEIKTFISNCYLKFSRLVLFKEGDIPEKKFRALDMAEKFATSDNQKLQRIAIYRERYIWDKDYSIPLEKEIRSYLESMSGQLAINTDEAEVLVFIADFMQENKINHKKIIKDNNNKNIDIKIIETFRSFQGIHLYKAKAARRNNHEQKGTYYEKAVEQLKNFPFFHYLWRHTIEFIEALKVDTSPYWVKLALDAWEICDSKEKNVDLGFQLRWYWADLKTLYDLAFEASILQFNQNPTENQPSLIKAVDIADSLKNRPVVKYQSIINRLKGKENAQELLLMLENAEMIALDGGYDNRYHDLVRKIKDSGYEHIPTRPIDAIPDNCSVYHFYLTHDMTCHVIMGVKERNKIALFSYYNIGNISALWEAYCEWDNIRIVEKLDSEKFKKALTRMIDKISDTFKNILNKTLQENVIFIPHGFLHGIPLQTVKIIETTLFIFNSENHLLQSRKCYYLPSWSSAPVEQPGPVHPPGSVNTKHTKKRNLLFLNWPKGRGDSLLNLGWTNITSPEKPSHSATDVIEVLKIDEPIDLLAIYCHGRGDFNNPRNSCFMLKDSTLSYHDISVLQTTALRQSKVLLQACETDFHNPGRTFTDEHLSLAHVFFIKGAKEVVASLFEAKTDVLEELTKKVKGKPSSSLAKCLHEVNKKWLTDKQPLYKVAVFRVTGFPE